MNEILPDGIHGKRGQGLDEMKEWKEDNLWGVKQNVRVACNLKQYE